MSVPSGGAGEEGVSPEGDLQQVRSGRAGQGAADGRAGGGGGQGGGGHADADMAAQTEHT